MIYDIIKRIADRTLSELVPFCERAEIAGSIRRKKKDCNDIEIVIVPRTRDLAGLADVVRRWHKVKGDIRGRYTQRRLPEGVKLDLFLTTPEKWGLIYAIRTGSAEFNHYVLAMGWNRKGYTSKEGILYPHQPGPCVYIREEKELFDFIGIEYVEPENRL